MGNEQSVPGDGSVAGEDHATSSIHDDTATVKMLKSWGLVHWPSKYDSEDDDTDVAEVCFACSQIKEQCCMSAVCDCVV
jgi:hypothetical protein